MSRPDALTLCARRPDKMGADRFELEPNATL